MPYKFVVAQDSKPFKDAPKVVLNALSRMTWAGHKVVTDGSFKDFNELLVLGYFEKQKISVRFCTLQRYRLRSDLLTLNSGTMMVRKIWRVPLQQCRSEAMPQWLYG